MKIKWDEVYKRYEQLDTGTKSLIKRATSLSQIKLSLVLFQLGIEPNTQCSRVVFCLPFFRHVEEGSSIGKACAKLDDGDNVGEEGKFKYTTIGKRLMRIVRLDSDNDIYEFRRLLHFLSRKTQDSCIAIDITSVCEALYYWGQADRHTDKKSSKEAIFESYLVEKYSNKKTQQEN